MGPWPTWPAAPEPHRVSAPRNAHTGAQRTAPSLPSLPKPPHPQCYPCRRVASFVALPAETPAPLPPRTRLPRGTQRTQPSERHPTLSAYETQRICETPPTCLNDPVFPFPCKLVVSLSLAGSRSRHQLNGWASTKRPTHQWFPCGTSLVR